MNSFSMTLFLFAFLFVSSCQVKDSAPGGGLISGHKPATNSFTLEAPAAQNYTTGDVVTLTYSFPYDIVMDTTSGSPRLNLTIGDDTRYADFVDQPTTKKLRFSYTIQALEEDTNGIDINALELNGSVLQFNDRGILTHCNIAGVSLTNLANQKVDTVAAAIDLFEFKSLPGYYREGDKVMFVATYNEPVYVTGVPYFTAEIAAGKTVNFSYEDGSGSKILSFSYTVTDTDAGNNGAFTSISSPLVGGSIKDAFGNNALLNFNPATSLGNTAAIRIIGDSPYVVGVTVPESKTYLAGSTLEVVLEFNREVNVTAAIPFIELTIGSNTRQAFYAPVPGQDKRFLAFHYTLNPGDVADGITIAPTITRNSSLIRNATAPLRDYFINFLIYNNNTFDVPDTSGIICNAIQPQAISASRAADTTIPKWGGTSPDNKWIIDQELFITVNFNTLIEVTQPGVPSIDVVLDSSTVQATYHSGNGQSSLIFRYVIKETDVDSGSITLGNINLNGGVLTDGTTNVATTLPATPITNTIIDGIRPTILTITPPDAKTYSTQVNVNHLNMLYNINWSEPVRYSSTSATTNTIKIPMDVGGIATPLQWHTGNNSSTITHRPTVLTGLNDNNGVTLSSPLTLTGSAVITDQAGNEANNFSFPLPDTSGILVDTTAPSIQQVEMVTGDGTYKANGTIDVSVTFTEPVTLTRSGSYPQIALDIGGNNRVMEALGDGEAIVHIFRYTIQPGDNDDNGVTVGSAIVQGGGSTIVDRGLNPSSLTFSAPDSSGVIVDTTGPSTTDASATEAKAYISGQKIELTVTFDEPVYVTGTPRIDVNFYAGLDNLDYVSGHGTDTLTFRRTMTPTHFGMDGLGSITTINPSIGSIKDLVGNDADRSFDAVDLSEHYVTYPQVTLWVKDSSDNLAPTATSTTIDTSGGSLVLNEAMDNVDHVFLKLMTPAIVGNHSFFNGEIQLVDNGSTFDVNISSGQAAFDGSLPLSSGPTFETNFVTSSNHSLYFQFGSNNYPDTSILVPNTFDGTMKEVLVIKNGLGSTEIDNLRAYFGF